MGVIQDINNAGLHDAIQLHKIIDQIILPHFSNHGHFEFVIMPMQTFALAVVFRQEMRSGKFERFGDQEGWHGVKSAFILAFFYPKCPLVLVLVV